MDQARRFQVRALGEIAIRCKNLAPMIDFYENIIGLERLEGNTSEKIVFFKIADGFNGHTAVLALFDNTLDQGDGSKEDDAHVHAGQSSSLHHIALSLPFEEQENVIEWYEVNKIPYSIERFEWIGWRGIFTKDPEGNSVELVAFDNTKQSISS